HWWSHIPALSPAPTHRVYAAQQIPGGGVGTFADCGGRNHAYGALVPDLARHREACAEMAQTLVDGGRRLAGQARRDTRRSVPILKWPPRPQAARTRRLISKIGAIRARAHACTPRQGGVD